MSTHYDVLGLPRTATHEQIVDQYHALAKVVHPDMGGDTVMFQVLQESYDVIGDPVERARYDQLLALGIEDDEPAPTAHRAPPRPAAYRTAPRPAATWQPQPRPTQSCLTRSWRPRREPSRFGIIASRIWFTFVFLLFVVRVLLH